MCALQLGNVVGTLDGVIGLVEIQKAVPHLKLIVINLGHDLFVSGGAGRVDAGRAHAAIKSKCRQAGKAAGRVGGLHRCSEVAQPRFVYQRRTKRLHVAHHKHLGARGRGGAKAREGVLLSWRIERAADGRVIEVVVERERAKLLGFEVDAVTELIVPDRSLLAVV